MLSIFKKIFGKSEPKAVVPVRAAVPAPPSTPMPTIEVAHLSLAAIVARFPDELRSLLTSEPDAAATVALPIPTILKQLPSGSVKMSLASLHRQAHGVILPLPPGDKRSVEVPLFEIFRHLRPDTLRRRADQRQLDVPDNGFNLFGDSRNPYAIAPDSEGHAAAEPEPEAPPGPQVLDLTADMPRVLKMDDGLRAQFTNGASAEAAPVQDARETMPRAISPPPDFSIPAPTPLPTLARTTPAPVAAAAAPAPASGSAPQSAGPALSMSLSSLTANWPEAIRAEIAALDPATQVALPTQEVSAGLGKGRVSFSWKQIHSWLEPAPAEPSAISGDTVLQLPLKIVAPLFLSSNKPASERKSFAVDESIPALFADARPPVEKPIEPPPAAESAPVEEPAEQRPADPVAEPVPEAPAAETEPQQEQAPAPAPEQQKAPGTVGEIFGDTQKQNWTPAELVAGTVKLSGVAGAIVALQEGLPVAASLPEGVKSDVVAAFLPQIFARLNQYAGEMRLGDVDDLLFTTHGAHCQIYRLGYIYFAVLGKAGEALPWHELSLITGELARHTQK
jgi:predicted regulator of Ras-like GTPase activity (Roadblock/LC7/MglB family)